MLKHQGGFKAGDQVEVRLSNSKELNFWRGIYIITDFKFLLVEVYHQVNEKIKDYPSSKMWVSIHDVRHPTLFRRING